MLMLMVMVMISCYCPKQHLFYYEPNVVSTEKPSLDIIGQIIVGFRWHISTEHEKHGEVCQEERCDGDGDGHNDDGHSGGDIGSCVSEEKQCRYTAEDADECQTQGDGIGAALLYDSATTTRQTQ